MAKGNNVWATTTDEQGREYLVNKETGEVKGKGFGMTDMSILPDIRKLIKKHPSSAELLFYFLGVSNKRNEVYLSQGEIAEHSGFNLSKIQTGVAILKKTGFILVKRQRGCNIYYINDRVLWQSSFADKQSKSMHTGRIKFEK